MGYSLEQNLGDTQGLHRRSGFIPRCLAPAVYLWPACASGLKYEHAVNLLLANQLRLTENMSRDCCNSCTLSQRPLNEEDASGLL